MGLDFPPLLLPAFVLTSHGTASMLSKLACKARISHSSPLPVPVPMAAYLAATPSRTVHPPMVPLSV